MLSNKKNTNVNQYAAGSNLLITFIISLLFKFLSPTFHGLFPGSACLFLLVVLRTLAWEGVVLPGHLRFVLSPTFLQS